MKSTEKHKYRISKYGQVYRYCNPGAQGCDDCNDYWYGCMRHKIYKRCRFTRNKIISMIQDVGDICNYVYIEERKYSFLVIIREESYAFTDYLIAHGWKDVPMKMWKKEVERANEECKEQNLFTYFDD